MEKKKKFRKKRYPKNKNLTNNSSWWFFIKFNFYKKKEKSKILKISPIIKEKIQKPSKKDQINSESFQNLEKSFKISKTKKNFLEFLEKAKNFIASKFYSKNYELKYCEISEKAKFVKKFPEFEKYFKYIINSIKIFYILCKCKKCSNCKCKKRENIKNEKKCQNCKNCILKKNFPLKQKKKITSAKRFIFNIIRNNLKKKLLKKKNFILKKKNFFLRNKNILFLLYYFDLDIDQISDFENKNFLKENLKKIFCENNLNEKKISFWEIYDNFYGKFIKKNQIFYLKNFKLYRDDFVKEFFKVKFEIFEKIFLFYEKNNNLNLENLKNFLTNIFRISKMESFINEI